MTDDEMLNDLTADVAGRFYKYLNTGTLKGEPLRPFRRQWQWQRAAS